MKRYLAIFISTLIFFLILLNVKLKISDKEFTRPEFYWGVYTNAFVFNQKDDAFFENRLNKQIPYWNDLSVNIIRFNHENILEEPQQRVNDTMVQKLTENNIIPYMIIESPFRNFFDEATYQKGFDWGYKIASRYKGKVKYYQLANEVSGTVIKKDYPGNNRSDYEIKKYQILKNYLLGLSHGIYKADSKAQRVVSAHWLGTAVIDMLIDDSLEFEIVGWDWYSDMSDQPAIKVLDDGTTLDIPAHFVQKNKKFWLVEINRHYGDWEDEGGEEQANYIKAVAKQAWFNKNITGFIIYKLFDTSSVDDGVKNADNSFGIIQDTKYFSGEFGPGDLKKAYHEYKKIIEQYKQNQNIFTKLFRTLADDKL